MKKIFTTIVAVALTISGLTQSPEKMSYQCVVRNSSGNLVTNQSVSIKISILQGSPIGAVVYQETYSPNPQTNANGLVSFEIGSGIPLTGIFSDINWTTGPYFLKTETDPAGGTNFTIVGTSQLLSVPYALYSNKAGNVFSGNYYDLTDRPVLFSGSYNDLMNTPTLFDGTWENLTGKPTFATVATSGSYNDLTNKPTITTSQWTTNGSNIYYNSGNVGIGTSSPATYIHAHGSPVESRGQLSLSSPSGEGTYISFYDADIFKAYLWYHVGSEDLRLQNYTSGDLNLNPYGGYVGVGTNSPSAALEVAGQVKITGGTPGDGQVLTSDENGLATWETPSVPQGTQTGQMQYWNGTAWVTVAPGNEGQVLTFVSGVPTWETQLADGEVKNPTTGKIWMDKNLGASQVATSSTDANAYGDLYQWGRAADGHQLRTSGITTSLSSTDTPGHGDFIIISGSPGDWRSPQNDNLWQGVSGTNNPCPSGCRLPTEAEWEAERASWSSDDAAGAFASPLKLPMAGYRTGSPGSLSNIGSMGRYWSSTVDGTSSRRLSFRNSEAYMISTSRAYGFSVRCIKD